MRRALRSTGVRLAIFGALLVATGLCAAGWREWSEYSRSRLRRELSVPDASPTERIQAIERAIARGETSVDELMDLLSDPDVRNRRDAARALGVIGKVATHAAPVLRQRLKDPNPLVRAAAIVALARVDPDGPEFAEQLRAAAIDADPNVREAAGDVMRHFRGRVVPVIVQLLTETNPRIRWEALRLMRRIAPQSSEARAALRQLIHDPDASVRDEAVISHLDGDQATMEEILDGIRAENPRVVSSAILALPRSPDKAIAALPELIRCIERPDLNGSIAGADPVSEALKWLQTFGAASQPAIPALLKLVGTAEQSIRRREIALETLVSAGADRETILGVLVPALTSDLSFVASEVLARFADDEARRQVPYLVERLPSADEKTTIAIVTAFYGMGPAAAAAVPGLSSLLTHQSARVVELSATTLRRLGPDAADAVPAIVLRLERRDIDERLLSNLVAALSAIGPAASPATSRLLEVVADRDENEKLRVEAMRAIAEIGFRTPAVVTHLTSALEDDSMIVRDGAQKALATLKNR